MVVSLVCTASLGLLGHQAVMVVMAVKESKVTTAARERLDPRDPQELLVSLERVAPKENLESRALPAIKGSAERVEQVESLGLLAWRLIRTGKSAHGKTWMTTKITVWLRWVSFAGVVFETDHCRSSLVCEGCLKVDYPIEKYKALYRIYTLVIRTSFLSCFLFHFRGGLGRVKRCQIVSVDF